jgi:lysophospholipase L1-like esterase
MLALSAFLGLLVVEGLVRWFDLGPGIQIDQWNERRKVVTGPEFKYYEELNAMGLRDHRDFPARTRSRRIILLGDSFVFGLGVSNEEAFPAVTEALLNDRTERSWTIVNAGKSGTGTVAQEQRLRELLDRLEVQGVVLFYFVENDPYDNMRDADALRGAAAGEWAGRLKNIDHPDALNAFRRWCELHLATYRFLKLRLGTVGTIRAFPFQVFDQCDPARTSSFAVMDGIMRDAVARMQADVRRAGADLLVVIIPAKEQVSDAAFAEYKKSYGVSDRPYDRRLPQRRVIENVLRPLGVAYRDLTDDFEGAPPDRYYYHYDAHFNAAGHRFVAEKVAAWLASRANP